MLSLQNCGWTRRAVNCVWTREFESCLVSYLADQEMVRQDVYSYKCKETSPCHSHCSRPARHSWYVIEAREGVIRRAISKGMGQRNTCRRPACRNVMQQRTKLTKEKFYRTTGQGDRQTDFGRKTSTEKDASPNCAFPTVLAGRMEVDSDGRKAKEKISPNWLKKYSSPHADRGAEESLADAHSRTYTSMNSSFNRGRGLV